MVEREVVAHLVSIDPECVVAVAPRLVGVPDVRQPRPATGEPRHDVEAVVVIGKVVARRRGRLVGQVADGGEIAVRRGGRAGQQPAPRRRVRRTTRRGRGGARHGNVELLLAVGDFAVVIRHAAGVGAHHLVDLRRRERVADWRVGKLDRHHQHIVRGRQANRAALCRRRRQDRNLVRIERHPIRCQRSRDAHRHSGLQLLGNNRKVHRRHLPSAAVHA